MLRADFHTHTTFCDGTNTPEEMVLGAIEKGMTAIGFSGHSYLPTGLDYCMSRENTVNYREEIARLKQVYGGKIEILCGLEQDVFSPDVPQGYDYIIGSVHNLCKDGVLCEVDHTADILEQGVKTLFGGDWYAAAENYFETVGNLFSYVKADVIGHFDLITKFNEGGRFFDETHPRYLAAARAAVDALLPYGVPFEVNTGAISRGYRTKPYPAPWLLAYIAQKGGRVLLSGDAHSVESLCHQFDNWEPVIRELGLRLEEKP